MARIRVFLALALFLSANQAALANGSLFSPQANWLASKHAASKSDRKGPSLFLKAPDRGLFAPRGLQGRQGKSKLLARPAQLVELRDLIQNAESRHDGYDAVQHGASQPPKSIPTRLTLGEIFQWIEDTPGQPHAIGRYQFIPATLRRLVARLGLSEHAFFSRHIQDQLADVLLAEAGLNKFHRNELSRRDFMHNLAKIWAGLPTASGQSYYHGHAGNKASISWATFDRKMTEIFPDRERQPILLTASR